MVVAAIERILLIRFVFLLLPSAEHDSLRRAYRHSSVCQAGALLRKGSAKRELQTPAKILAARTRSVLGVAPSRSYCRRAASSSGARSAAGSASARYSR